MQSDYPSYEEVGKLATDYGLPGARLLVMAIAKLSTTAEFSSFPPEETYDAIVTAAKEVYKDKDANKTTVVGGGTTRGE